MRALTWHGKEDIRCDSVPDPTIQEGRDAIIKVNACAICGSDLHLMGGFVPTMESGDILGHECMGEVVEVGRDNTKLKIGEAVGMTVSGRHNNWFNKATGERIEV